MHNCMFRQILSPDDEAEEAREKEIEKFFEKFKVSSGLRQWGTCRSPFRTLKKAAPFAQQTARTSMSLMNNGLPNRSVPIKQYRAVFSLNWDFSGPELN